MIHETITHIARWTREAIDDEVFAVNAEINRELSAYEPDDDPYICRDELAALIDTVEFTLKPFNRHDGWYASLDQFRFRTDAFDGSPF